MEDSAFEPVYEEIYSDSMRLEWLLKHSGAIFEKESENFYLTVYLTSGDALSGGVAGTFISRGNTKRDCIDVFLSNKSRRVE